jgi:hypothetical protein
LPRSAVVAVVDTDEVAELVPVVLRELETDEVTVDDSVCEPLLVAVELPVLVPLRVAEVLAVVVADDV